MEKGCLRVRGVWGIEHGEKCRGQRIKTFRLQFNLLIHLMTCTRHVSSIPIIIGRAVCKRPDLCRKFVRPLRARQTRKAVVRRMCAKI